MSSKRLGVITLALLITFLLFAAYRSSTKTFNFNFITKNSELEKIVQSELEGKKGNFAVVVEELHNSKNSYQLNSEDSFPSASLYKLYLMAAVLQKVEQNELKLDEVIKAEKSYLDERLGGEENGYKDYRTPIEYSVDEGLKRIGRISDNYAAIMLADKLGGDQELQKVADQLGSKSTRFDTEVISTTAKDTANFFKKLYQGEVVSKAVSEQIISYLELSQLNNRIPAQLPAGTKVIHKTGELPRLRHDGGIVYLADRPYLIVLMSQNVEFEDSTIELLSNISKQVFDYFSN